MDTDPAYHSSVKMDANPAYQATSQVAGIVENVTDMTIATIYVFLNITSYPNSY